ncbi:helix-turn-helix domain-containing protein [Colwelliaceae bacterium MEBiC 14330]
MDKTLFNIHDLILLLTIFECFALSWLIYSTRKEHGITYLLLAAFFAAHGLSLLHELILWGSTFRDWVLTISPNIFFALNFSYLLDGPLIFLFLASQLTKTFQLKKSHLIHVIPALVIFAYLWGAFWSLSYDNKTQLIISHDIAYSSHYVIVDFVGKLIRLAYVGYSIYLLSNHLRHSVLLHSAKKIMQWQLYLIISFFIIVCIETLLIAIKVYGLTHSINLDVLQLIGLSSYYLQFALINTVIYIIAVKALNSGGFKKAKKQEAVDMTVVAILEDSMNNKKLYLNPNLSSERLAEQLKIANKDLSNIINHHFNVNFYEYINSYRIEEAKQQLEQAINQSKNITDIFYEAGFNSKSVYNTLFKKKYQMTPSQYRKAHKQKMQ